jgi:hypothetical protein
MASRQFSSVTPKLSSIISERSQPAGDRSGSITFQLMSLGESQSIHRDFGQIIGCRCRRAA